MSSPPSLDESKISVDARQMKRDALQSCNFFSAHSPALALNAFEKMNFPTVFRCAGAFKKMNFYCSTNHKYGNSILDFASKLLKFLRNCAFNAYNVQALPPSAMSPSFVFFCSAPKTRRRKETTMVGKGTLKIYRRRRGFFGGARSELSVAKSEVCNCFPASARVACISPICYTRKGKRTSGGREKARQEKIFNRFS